MAGSILGNRVLRKEDPKFLTTGGVYVDDLRDEPLLQGALHVTYVRSTVAHGTITSIDTADAAAMPGVIAIYTAEDLGLQPVPSDFNPGVARGLLAWADERGVRARGGLAHGPVVTAGGDVYGSTVNLASRIADIAVPGEVLVDEGVTRAAPYLEFEPAGRRQLKGFTDPVRLWALER